MQKGESISPHSVNAAEVTTRTWLPVKYYYFLLEMGRRVRLFSAGNMVAVGRGCWVFWWQGRCGRYVVLCPVWFQKVIPRYFSPVVGSHYTHREYSRLYYLTSVLEVGLSVRGCREWCLAIVAHAEREICPPLFCKCHRGISQDFTTWEISATFILFFWPFFFFFTKVHEVILMSFSSLCWWRNVFF